MLDRARLDRMCPFAVKVLSEITVLIMHPLWFTMLAAGYCAVLSSATAGAQSLAEMENRSATIAERYLAVWSSNDEASVAGVPYIYGPRIAFYGRTLDQRALAAEKRRAIRQWPVRSYWHRPGSMRVLCNENARRCAARSIIDYRVANPGNGQQARGSATFDLGISFAGPRPVILYETGRPVRRGERG